MSAGTSRTKNQSIATAVPPMLIRNREQLRISTDIMRRAESSCDAVWEVGDGHSSADAATNINAAERRAISPNDVSNRTRRPAVTAEKAQAHPKQWVREFQRKLYRAAKKSPERTFGLLYDKVCMPVTLREAWRRVRVKGEAAGVDRVTVECVERDIGVETFLKEIQETMRQESYKADLIRRVYIPKGETGKTRPLGIPTLKDKVAQMAVKIVTEPAIEADFLECSYGFRPKRSNQAAAQRVHKISNRNKWVVDVDLKSYFDTISHSKLMELLRKRVSDRRLLALVRQWLEAGILEDGRVTHTDMGTPQGGVLSPLLSNLYLHEIDRQWHESSTIELVRFADDMIFMCRSERQARWVLRKLRTQLRELGLTLNEEKTCVRHVEDGFDFLGFTYREAYSRRMKRKVRIKTPRTKSVKKMKRSIKEAVRDMQLGTDLIEIVGVVNRKLRGWANYFKIGNCYAAALELSSYACEQLRIYWRRTKHRKRINGYRKWPNSYFYNKGLHYVPRLVQR